MSAHRETILEIASLVSDGGTTAENPEYDRALVEVTGRLIGADLGDEYVREVILLMLRNLS